MISSRASCEAEMVTQIGADGARRTAEISRVFEGGLAHHQAGRRDRAEAVFRKVLRRAPDHVGALHFLGVIAYERGRYDRAVQLLAQAVARAPDYADAHVNLGAALRALGRLDEAAANYRKAIALRPDNPYAHSNLATVLHLQGFYEAALESGARAAELMPDFAEAQINCGLALNALRRFAEAETALRKALVLQPKNAETISALGLALFELRRLDEAAACQQQAVALQPDNALMCLRLAGDPYGSEGAWRQGISLDPYNAQGWSGLGQTLRVLGRFEEARSCFRRALDLDPEWGEAYAGLAILGEQAGDEAQVQRLRALLERPDCPPALRSDAGFALGMLLDNADRYDEAFACFSKANAVHRQMLADTGYVFSRAVLRQRVDSLIASCTPALYAAVEGEGNPSELPVFIVGMPRSGTSLVEQIAATHSRVFGAGELKDISNIVDAVQAHGQERPADQLDPDLARRLADDYVARLQSRAGDAARVIDKMPDNILHLGLVGVLFPAARVIFCRRDPRDICLSCYFRKFDEAITFAQDLGDSGFRAQEVERLADHWRSALPQRTLTIDYEALVADLEGESRRLIEFLGLDWEPACLEFHKTERPVLTASGWQVRQPLFTRSVGRWQKYEKHLGPLFEVLAEGSATG
jgi:tetratricopeptide (TPR) repeat protein